MDGQAPGPSTPPTLDEFREQMWQQIRDEFRRRFEQWIDDGQPDLRRKRPRQPRPKEQPSQGRLFDSVEPPRKGAKDAGH